MRLLVCSMALSLLLVPPTATAQEWQGQEEVVDGVTHVRNPARGMLPSEVVELEEVWRLGGESEAEEEFFGVISDILVDADHNMYILDMQLSEVRVFDEAGTYLRTLGREGEGPGEFRRPVSMAFFPDGGLGVIQAWPSKMVRFDASGNPGADFAFKPEGAGFASLTDAAMSGKELALIYGLSEPQEGRFVSTAYLGRVGLDGKLSSVLTSAERSMDYANSLCIERDWNQFERCWAAGRDGRVYARRAFTEYAVDYWAADGTHRVIHREAPALKRSSKDIEKIKSAWAAMIARWVPNPSFEIEPNWNPVESIVARADGSVWIRPARGAHDLEPGVLTRFDVFDAQGRYLQELVMNGSFDPDNDGLFVEGAYLFVVTDLISAAKAFQGGAGDGEAEDDAEPMTVICYRMNHGSVASK